MAFIFIMVLQMKDSLFLWLNNILSLYIFHISFTPSSMDGHLDQIQIPAMTTWWIKCGSTDIPSTYSFQLLWEYIQK